MNDSKKMILENAGIDMDENIERFMGNVALMDRFFLKFMSDENFAKLTEAIENGDTEEAFNAAHTLKGVCGNLSFKSLEKIVGKQTVMLRSGDLESAIAIMPKVSHEYEKLSDAFRTCLPLAG